MTQKKKQLIIDIVKTILGSALFGLGFNLFLEPSEINAGGLSGLAMIVVYLTKFGTVGTITTLMNIPLFILGGMKVGKRFFWGSLVGMFFTSLFLDLFALLPVPTVEPLMAALYGGIICGFGLGFVFAAGFSTGGSDIVVRLIKMRWPNVQIGVINICFDMCVAVLTGLVYWDLQAALYSGVAIFVTGKMIDMVVYHFDYSKVALIITKEYDQVASKICDQLDRGVTFLYGQGSYTQKDTKVILTAVKKQQVAELKELVVDIDPKAFIIVQEAHQVLGDGFSRYSKDAL